MTCIRDTSKFRKMSLSYINSLMRRSPSTRSDIRNHSDRRAEDSDEEKSNEEQTLKTGFLSHLKQRFQRSFPGVGSKHRSKLRKSSSHYESVIENSCEEPAVSSFTEAESSEFRTAAEADSSELRTQSLSESILQLSKYGWYWGPITREEAEEKLANQPDGSFLVRDSSNDHFLLSVSFRCSGRTFHSRIFHSSGKFSFYSDGSSESSSFNSIPELVEYSISSSQSTVFCYSRPRSPGHPSFPVRLAKPVSRTTVVRSLQYLCRFVIRQYIRVDQIKDLPLPARICCYIEEGQF